MLQMRLWLDALVDLLKQMLRYEPSARIRAKQALDHEFFKDLPTWNSTGFEGSPTPQTTARDPPPPLVDNEVIVLED